MVLGDDVIDAGVRFGDLIDDVKRSLSALTSNVMRPLMKVLSQMTDKGIGCITKIQPKLLEFADIQQGFLDGSCCGLHRLSFLSDKLEGKAEGTDRCNGFAESVIGWRRV